MDFIRSWTALLTGTIVFGSICEMLMPDGDIKKYIRIILGLVLVFAIVRPMINVTDKDFMIAELEQSRTVAYMTHEEMDERQKFDIIRTYKKNLSQKINNDIEVAMPGIVSEVRIEVETEDEKKFGEIKTATVIITSAPGDANMSDTVTKILKNEYGITEDKIIIKHIKQKG